MNTSLPCSQVRESAREPPSHLDQSFLVPEPCSRPYQTLSLAASPRRFWLLCHDLPCSQARESAREPPSHHTWYLNHTARSLCACARRKPAAFLAVYKWYAILRNWQTAEIF